MDSVKLISREEEKKEISLAADPAAQRRLKTLLDLAISIGQREGLIRNYSENTATETLKASAHDPSACNEANVPIGKVPRQRFHKELNK